MAKPIRLGILTPSSNTALEPLTQAMAAAVPQCTAHFARFEVQEISLRPQALGQFDIAPILAAARLLAHARVDAICWSGTAAGWLGVDADVRLCEAIREQTGIPATSAVLALNELLALNGVSTLGLVSPYVADVQARIEANYAQLGIPCVAERHLDITVNFDFGLVEPARLRTLIDEVAAAGPQAIAVYCTNLRAAALAEAVEREHGVLLLDTVATAVWGALRAAGADPRQVRGWGRLFASA